MANDAANVGTETTEHRFAKIFSREPFKGLKAIIDCVSSDREGQCAAANDAHSYEELLSRLGYRITLPNQIHIQHCHARVAGNVSSTPVVCQTISTSHSPLTRLDKARFYV